MGNWSHCFRMYQAEEELWNLSWWVCCSFGRWLGERKWRLGTSTKAGWMLSTPASENKTHHDASLFTSSWHPCVFGELEISGYRVKTLWRNWKPSHLAFFLFPKSAKPLCSRPQAGGPLDAGDGCLPVTGWQWLKRKQQSEHAAAATQHFPCQVLWRARSHFVQPPSDVNGVFMSILEIRKLRLRIFPSRNWIG